MGLGTDHVTITTADKFIPELWSDETIALYKQKLVLANLITNISFKGKKGDTLHIPVPARGDASIKAAGSQVTLVTDTATAKDIVVNKHYEYSYLFEDLAAMQSLNSMRNFYTDAAAYGLARRIDRELHKIGIGFQGGASAAAATYYEKGFIGGDGTTLFSGGANTNTGNGSALTDSAIRRSIQRLEDSDIDNSEIKFVIPPVESNVLRGIPKFTEHAFIGNGSVIKTGMLGVLYGMEIFTSTNCPFVHVNSVTGTQSVNFSGTGLGQAGASYADDFATAVDWNSTSPTDTQYRPCLMLHKDAMVLATQQSIRTQSQYKQEYLGTLVTSDCVFGTLELRDYAALCLLVPA